MNNNNTNNNDNKFEKIGTLLIGVYSTLDTAVLKIYLEILTNGFEILHPPLKTKYYVLNAFTDFIKLKMH